MKRTDHSILAVLTCPPPWHGANIMNSLALKALQETGWRTNAITPRYGAELSDIGGRFSCAKVLELLKTFAKTCKVLFKCRPDLFYTSLNAQRVPMLRDILLSVPALLFRVPVVCHAHFSRFDEFAKNTDIFTRWLAKLYTRNIRSIIVLANTLRPQFSSFVAPEKVKVVQNGLPDSAVPSVEKKFDDQPTVLFLSNLIESKGYLDLLEAVPPVLKRFPSASFTFIGAPDKTEISHLEKLCSKRGLAKNVKFLGLCLAEQKNDALRNSWLLAFPTYYINEAFPLVLIESLMWGLPVVTTRVGAIEEIIESNQNGVFVSPQNPDELANEIINLLSNPLILQRLSQNNRTKYEALFTYEIFRANLSKALLDCL